MPKLIDYPRTTYSGAWELAEVTDDTGGKCAIDTAARKLNRKVSGSFKAIIGSAVKFGLLTSKRDLLTTTTLFKRIKHAYDKQEELIFHREAFLTPPLFTQICRKFRSRELPVQMLDVMLIREFGVEEINAQGVSKAFVEGARMVGLLDENNIIADIDALSARNILRHEKASPQPTINTFRKEQTIDTSDNQNITISPQMILTETITNNKTQELRFDPLQEDTSTTSEGQNPLSKNKPTANTPSRNNDSDAIANLFGILPILTSSTEKLDISQPVKSFETPQTVAVTNPIYNRQTQTISLSSTPEIPIISYQIQISGPGVNSNLSITEEADIILAIALLEKIRRQLKF